MLKCPTLHKRGDRKELSESARWGGGGEGLDGL